MTYYNFKKGIFLVQGHVNGCIYDTNDLKLYAINSSLMTGLVELIANHRIIDDNLKQTIDQLIDFGLLEITDSARDLSDIKSIGEKELNFEFGWVKVTDQCNQTCIHCFEEASPQLNSQMSLKDFKKAIQELSKTNFKAVTIFGGEPLLLRQQLPKMIAYCSKFFENYFLFTNGTLIDNYWIEVFKRYKTTINLSLHSFNREDHEKVTQLKGSYDKLYRSIDLLKNNSIPHKLSMVFMKGVNPGTKNIDSKFTYDIVRLAGRADLKLLDETLLRDKMITQETFTEQLDLAMLKRNVVKHRCFCRRIYVNTDLTIYPCSKEKRFCHGNLRDRNIKDILRDDILYMSKDKIDGCQQCEYRYACVDCRPDTLGGDGYEKPWNCTYDPIAGEWMDVDEYIKGFNLEDENN